MNDRFPGDNNCNAGCGVGDAAADRLPRRQELDDEARKCDLSH